jgi:hypothetical protein
MEAAQLQQFLQLRRLRTLYGVCPILQGLKHQVGQCGRVGVDLLDLLPEWLLAQVVAIHIFSTFLASLPSLFGKESYELKNPEKNHLQAMNLQIKISTVLQEALGFPASTHPSKESCKMDWQTSCRKALV